MKKLVLSLLGAFALIITQAQSEKFVKAMEPLVLAADSTRDEAGLTDLANSFERIANAEKTQWLPYYYAALCHINKANIHFQKQELDKIDAEVNLAEPLLNKADELEKNNSEVYALKKMFNTAKMMGDPMNRYMTYGAEAAKALETAKTLNPENPRIYLLEGIDKYYTPEQFGGSKDEGKKLFQEALKKFESFKPTSSIHPSWGIGQVRYFLTLP
jgi:hypothetical protein